MRPSQVATELRKIAAAIEASKTPDKTKVASAIKGLVKKISSEVPSVVSIDINNGDYSAMDLVYEMKEGLKVSGSIWAAFTDSVFVAINSDPKSLKSSSPVDVLGSGSKTWDEVEGFDQKSFKKYSSMKEFLQKEDTIIWFCSHGAFHSNDIIEGLEESGVSDLAESFREYENSKY